MTSRPNTAPPTSLALRAVRTRTVSELVNPFGDVLRVSTTLMPRSRASSRRVDEVDDAGLEQAAEQPLQHRHRHRLDVEGRDLAGILDRQLPGRILQQLGLQVAEALGQDEIRPQDLQLLGADRRHVHGAVNDVEHQELDDLLGDRDRRPRPAPRPWRRRGAACRSRCRAASSG